MASEKMPNLLGSEECSLNGFLEASIVGFEVNVQDVYDGSLMEPGRGHYTIFQCTSAKTSKFLQPQFFDMFILDIITKMVICLLL